MVQIEDLPAYMPTVTFHRPLGSSTDLPEGFSSFRFTQIPLLLALPIALSHFTRDIIFMKSTLTSHFRRSHCCRGLLTVCISKTRAASIPYENMFSCLIYADTDTKLLGINHTNASWNILLSPV